MALSGAAAQDTFNGWDLESSVEQAHLIMVVRVASISKLTVVEGAKTETAYREYRFEPIRRLKGIFARDRLSMTGGDLGLPAETASSAQALKEGEFRLLMLTQQQGGPFGGVQTFGCVSAAAGATTFNERVPHLTAPDDPLVTVVETLIKVSDSRSRRERARLLVDRLREIDGLASVPVLTSLEKRADWVALDDRAYWYVATLAGGPLEAKHGAAEEVHRDDAYPREMRVAAISGAALNLLRDMLAYRHVPQNPKQLEAVDAPLSYIPKSKEAHTLVRIAALEAIGHRLMLKPTASWARELLTAELHNAATYAERDAAVTALSRIAQPEVVIAVRDALTNLPLDEAAAREMIYGRAAIRLDPHVAERVLLDRLKRSIAARQSIGAEVKLLGRLRSKESLPLLLEAAGDGSVSQTDRQQIAIALGRLKDDRAVPVLIGWMRESDYQLRDASLSALENIGSQAAANELRPLFKFEQQLAYKLRIARLLTRQFMGNECYPVVAQHLADAEHRADAALILSSMESSRPAEELSEILKSPPDRRWHAAALVGLAAMGGSNALKEVREILADERNPLIADAAEAAGLTSDRELLLPLARLVQSRNKQTAMSSLLALRRFLSGVRSSPRGLAKANADESNVDDNELAAQPAEDKPSAEVPEATRAAIDEAVASLLLDTYVDPEIRHEAFAVARLLHGPRYGELLSKLADQAELEGTPLLSEVQAEQRRAPAAIK